MTSATKLLLTVSLALFLGAPLPGCKGDAEEPAKGPEKAAATGTEGAEADASFAAPFTAAVAAAKLKAEPLEKAAARPYQAAECLRGGIERLDVLICRYEDAAAAQAGEQRLLQFASGAVSGAARIQATLGLAIADRDKADPTGKTIQRLLTLFIDPSPGG